MEKTFLIVNPGSASKKYTLYVDHAVFYDAHYEIEKSDFLVTWQTPTVHKTVKAAESEFSNSLQHFIGEVVKQSGQEIFPEKIGIRVVAPGEEFQKHQRVDAKFIKNLQTAAADDPLHIGDCLKELEKIQKIFPKAKVFSISDSVFHHSINHSAQLIAIDRKDSLELGLKRYGYHGLSVQAVVDKILSHHSGLKRIVVCHLGSGGSVTAVKDRKSYDTSMGYTPLEGLIMATRVGDIDPGALLRLGKRRKMSYEQLENYFYQLSGLRGIAGQSDMRTILAQADSDKMSKLALDAYVYRIKKYIGAYAAVMGGLDAIVFTGTIGYRAWKIRDMVASDLHFLGVNFDHVANKKLDKEGVVSRVSSRVRVFVLHSDENREMLRVLKSLKG